MNKGLKNNLELKKENQKNIDSSLKLRELVKKGTTQEPFDDVMCQDYVIDSDEFKQVCKYLLKESEK